MRRYFSCSNQLFNKPYRSMDNDIFLFRSFFQVFIVGKKRAVLLLCQ